MGAKDFLKGMSQSDLDRSRTDRENRQNSPDYEPGQGGNDMFDDDFFGGGAGDAGGGMPQGGAEAGGFGDAGFGGGFGGGFDGGFGQSQQPQQPPKKAGEDIFFEILTLGGTHVWKFAKELISSFKGLTAKYWSIWGTTTAKVGLGSVVVGIVIRLFGAKIGFDITIGGILTTATGVLVLMLNVDKANGLDSEYLNPPVEQQPQDDFMQDNTDLGESDDFLADNSSDEEYAEYEDEEEVYEEEDDFDLDALDDVYTEPEKPMDTDEALASLPEISKGMFTRQYLYEALMKKLQHITPNFDTIRDISEDSDDFVGLEEQVRKAGRANGFPDEKLPELVWAKETLFKITLCTTRVKGLPAEKLGDELASIISYDPDTGQANADIFAIGRDVGENSYIDIFTGAKKMVSLKDMYNSCKEFVLDNKNYIPVVLGVDQSGKVIISDFKSVESILIAGMPRTGKSWLVQAVITQMCAFVPPSEMHLYIGDPKEGISDFKSFTLPHVKKFVCEDNKIVEMLKDIVKVEAPRRKKILGDAGFVNIWDFKEKYPNVDMPVIYVLIDEVVTLAMRMEKEVKAEFQGYLTELISQLPALGIRAFLIPHVIKNDIIAKKTTDLIQCRVSVAGNASHIKDCLDVTEKQFPYKLGMKGEIALKMPSVSRDAQYLRSVVLSPTNNGNNEIFDYLRQMWMRLEPNCEKDSVARDVDKKKEQDKLLTEVNSITETDSDDIFNLNFNESDTPNSQGQYSIDDSIEDSEEDNLDFEEYED